MNVYFDIRFFCTLSLTDIALLFHYGDKSITINYYLWQHANLDSLYLSVDYCV